jgi:hypothetical protein
MLLSSPILLFPTISPTILDSFRVNYLLVMILFELILYLETSSLKMYCILSSNVRPFLMENDAEIFPAHYTWKVAEKGFKMASMMNKLAMINSCEIIREK